MSNYKSLGDRIEIELKKYGKCSLLIFFIWFRGINAFKNKESLTHIAINNFILFW